MGLFAAASMAFAQNETNSDQSGNQPSAGRTGYTYEFNTPFETSDENDDVQCLNEVDPTSGNPTVWNTENRAGYSFGTGEGSLLIDLDGSQGEFSVPNVRFTEDNCANVIANPIDLSGTDATQVKVRLRSDVDVADFRIIVAILSNDQVVYADFDATSVALTGDNEWQELTLEGGTKQWSATEPDGVVLDLSQAIGFGFKAVNGATDNPQGTIEIDYITFGDGVITSNEEAVVSNVNIFPNPSTGVVNVEAEAGQSIVIRDMVGAEVAAGTENLTVNDLQAGIYVATITTAEGVVVETRKVIVK